MAAGYNSKLAILLQRYPQNEVKTLTHIYYNLPNSDYLARTTDSFTNGHKSRILEKIYPKWEKNLVSGIKKKILFLITLIQ